MPMISSTPSLLPHPSFHVISPIQGTLFSQRKQLSLVCKNQKSKDNHAQDSNILHSEDVLRRKFIFSVLLSTGVFPSLSAYGKAKSKNPYDERRLLEQNKRVQRENNAPEDFPNFVREGFQVQVVASDSYVKRNSGLVYRDFEVGKGDCPKDGQQVFLLSLSCIKVLADVHTKLLSIGHRNEKAESSIANFDIKTFASYCGML